MRFKGQHDAEAICALTIGDINPKALNAVHNWLKTEQADRVLIISARKARQAIDKIKAP